LLFRLLQDRRFASNIAIKKPIQEGDEKLILFPLLLLSFVR